MASFDGLNQESKAPLLPVIAYLRGVYGGRVLERARGFCLGG